MNGCRAQFLKFADCKNAATLVSFNCILESGSREDGRGKERKEGGGSREERRGNVEIS